MLLHLLLLALVTLTSAQDAVCATDGTEYRISDVVFGCSAAWGASEIELANGQEVYVMLVPEHVVDLNMTLSANMDVDIIIKDATDMTVPGALLPCIVGPSCEISQPGEYTWPTSDGTMTIIYTGDDQSNPVYEHVFIPHTDRPLAYTVKAHADGSAVAYYDYAGVEPCQGESGECASCTDYTGCKAPYTAKCDGTTSVNCVIPTQLPTQTPTMSEFELLYRECSQQLADTEFEKEQSETMLGMCAERGISCTESPSTTPTRDPSNKPSVTPTDEPTDMPTISPTDDPTHSEPTRQPTNPPSNQPTWSPTCDCYDLIPAGEPFWYDNIGMKYTCSWYASDPERHCHEEHPNFGLTAKQACCICRGGSCAMPTLQPSVDPTMDPTDEPTVDPTNKPTMDPTEEPTNKPTERPTSAPSSVPTDNPSVKVITNAPTDNPTPAPTEDPTKTPSSYPTERPSNQPTEVPSKFPTDDPTKNPSTAPTPAPTTAPSTPDPSSPPTEQPTQVPTDAPSLVPTNMPTDTPSSPPTFQPTRMPTGKPIGTPSRAPSAGPTISCKDLIPAGEEKWTDGYGTGYGCEWYAVDVRFCSYDDEHYQNFGMVAKEACCVCGGGSSFVPTYAPSVKPSFDPTKAPLHPSSEPTENPTNDPTLMPTDAPTRDPSKMPTASPTRVPTYAPTPDCYDFLVDGVSVWYDAGGPKYTCAWYEGDPERFCAQHGDENANFGKTATQACAVCGACLHDPDRFNPPTDPPTSNPTDNPTTSPTKSPTDGPTHSPTNMPTDMPTNDPTTNPTFDPSKMPTDGPTSSPTNAPTKDPSFDPTTAPSNDPTTMPTDGPTKDPSQKPTASPTRDPTPLTPMPTDTPTVMPTDMPSESPTDPPSHSPTHTPTPEPTDGPTFAPTDMPTSNPSDHPTLQPTHLPTKVPVCDPCFDLVPADSPTGFWYDSFGETYSCAFYNSEPWRFCQYDAESYSRFGLVASQACCACGGGSCGVPTMDPTDAPSDMPTDMPSDMPTNMPTNNPSLMPTDMPSDMPTNMPTDMPTDRPTQFPSPQPTLMPTDNPSFQPTDNPGTDPPTFAPTELPTQSCAALLADALENCATDCEEAVSEPTSSYEDTIPVGAVDASMVNPVDGYTLGKMEEAGVPSGIGIMQYDGQFYIENAKDGSYIPTCVQYNSVSTTPCQDDLVCSGSGDDGAGSTVGWGGNMASSLLEALERADSQHPECPTGCNDLTEWWVSFFQSNGVSSADSLCLVDEGLYYMDSEGVKHFTCVGFGASEDMCSNGQLICSGMNSQGEIIFGYGSSIAKSLQSALSQTDYKHAQCPECCSCS